MPMTPGPHLVDNYRAVLDVDPMDADAINRLDALLVKTQAWRDLADLLERRIDSKRARESVVRTRVAPGVQQDEHPWHGEARAHPR